VSEIVDRTLAAILPEAATVTAKAPVLLREMSSAAAFRAIADECRCHIEGNLSSVLEARDTEGLHQLRVGFRRLDIALANFAPGAVELRARAKSTFEATAAARDLDVFLAELFEPVVAELEPQDGFAILRTRGESARARAWDAAVAQVSNPALARFLHELDADAEQVCVNQTPIRDHAGAMLDRHLARARKRGKGLKAPSNEGAHRLRIALKKLRYTADFFASLYRERPVQRYLAEIKKLQDMLGALNDAAQVRATLGRLMMEEATSAPVQAELSFAAGLINGWHHARAAHFKRKARRLWRSFRQTEPFWA